MREIFTSKEIFLRLINCSFCWFVLKQFMTIYFAFVVFIHRKWMFKLIFGDFFRITITLVYYGLSLTSVELSGTKYVNFMLVNAIEIPAFLTSWYFMEHFPRRKTQALSFLLSGVGCIMVNTIPKRN